MLGLEGCSGVIEETPRCWFGFEPGLAEPQITWFGFVWFGFEPVLVHNGKDLDLNRLLWNHPRTTESCFSDKGFRPSGKAFQPDLRRFQLQPFRKPRPQTAQFSVKPEPPPHPRHDGH